VYLHLELKTMATDRLDEAVARLHYLHSLMSTVDGFLDAQICEFLGNPAQYLVTRAWTDQQSHTVGYRQSSAAKEFAASRPEGFIYDNQAVEEWETVLDTSTGMPGPYVVRKLDASPSDPGAEGLTSLRQYRRLGVEDARSLVIERWESRDAYVAYLQTLGPGQEAGLVECYQVVDEVRPA
jgi:heme-degrading monooxygenase HmoA